MPRLSTSLGSTCKLLSARLSFLLMLATGRCPSSCVIFCLLIVPRRKGLQMEDCRQGVFKYGHWSWSDKRSTHTSPMSDLQLFADAFVAQGQAGPSCAVVHAQNLVWNRRWFVDAGCLRRTRCFCWPHRRGGVFLPASGSFWARSGNSWVTCHLCVFVFVCMCVWCVSVYVCVCICVCVCGVCVCVCVCAIVSRACVCVCACVCVPCRACKHLICPSPPHAVSRCLTSAHVNMVLL